MSAPPPDPLPLARLRPRARMHLPGEFKRCLDAGQRMGGAFYRCSVRMGADREPRIGFAISRKVDKRAVVRNRLKRVARDTFRRHRHRLPAGALLRSPPLVRLHRTQTCAGRPSCWG